MADDLNMLRGGGAGGESGGAGGARQRASGGGTGEGLTRSVEDHQREGRSRLPGVRGRYFRYDRVEGMANADLRGDVFTADRLSPDRVRELLHQIHVAHGVDRSMENYLYVYDHYMMLCYALNSGSQLLPLDRAGFVVHGDPYEFGTIVSILGIDLRRFFRSLADEVVTACKTLYFECNWQDPVQVALRAQMDTLSGPRECVRFPYLVSDVAEAATNLDATERAASLAKKGVVVGKTTNAVDQRNGGGAVRSLDNYDSSTGRHVNGAHDITQGGGSGLYH